MSMTLKTKLTKSQLQEKLRELNLPVSGNVPELKRRLAAAKGGIKQPDPPDPKALQALEPSMLTAEKLVDRLVHIESDEDVRRIDAALRRVINPLEEEIRSAFDQNVTNWQVVEAMTKNSRLHAEGVRDKYLGPVLEAKRRLKLAVGEYEQRKHQNLIEDHERREREIRNMTVEAIEDEIVKLHEAGEIDSAEDLMEELELREAQEIAKPSKSAIKKAMAPTASAELVTVMIPDREKIGNYLNENFDRAFLLEAQVAMSNLAENIGGVEISFDWKLVVVDNDAVRDEFKKPSTRSRGRAI